MSEELGYIVAQTGFSRVFLIEGRARPDHAPTYESCLMAGSPSVSFGDVERIEPNLLALRTGLAEPADLVLELRLELLRTLVLGYRGEHPLQAGQLLVGRLRVAVVLLGPLVVWGQVRRHGAIIPRATPGAAPPIPASAAGPSRSRDERARSPAARPPDSPNARAQRPDRRNVHSFATRKITG